MMMSKSPERETEPVRDLTGDVVPDAQAKGVRSVPIVWSKALRRIANCVDAALRRPPRF